MTITAYVAEYSSDGGNTFECGDIKWTIDAATAEARSRSKVSLYRLRRIILHDAGVVGFVESARSSMRVLEAERTAQEISGC